MDLPRNIALLDTNVIVAFGDPRDSLHQHIQELLELDDYRWAVTLPVIVEACGLLTSRAGTQAALRVVLWLCTPGNMIILPALHPPHEGGAILAEHGDWMRRRSIDYVDSALMHTADRLTEFCTLRPATPIVTSDTRDFLPALGHKYRFSLFDVRALELVHLD